jgi:hypothetical protein
MALFDLAWQTLNMNMPLFCSEPEKTEKYIVFKTSFEEAVSVQQMPCGSVCVTGSVFPRARECLGINDQNHTMVIWTGNDNNLLESVRLDDVWEGYMRPKMQGQDPSVCFFSLTVTDPVQLDMVLSHMARAMSLLVEAELGQKEGDGEEKDPFFEAEENLEAELEDPFEAEAEPEQGEKDSLEAEAELEQEEMDPLESEEEDA